VHDKPVPEDIVAQGSERGPRFTIPGWWPSRAAAILAVVTLLAGLAAGYAIGNQQGGRARPAGRAPTTRPASPALTELPGTCSTQIGNDLELGIPVTNMSAETVLLRSAEPIADPPGLLRVLSWRWGPCGFDADGIILNTVALGPGETTWLTATVRPLVACPTASPLQFRVTYSVRRRKSEVRLPGFADLGTVRYSGCQGQ
jgi:hypothetical protein